MPKENVWDGSAAEYARYAPTISFYRETSSRLVQLADLHGVATIIDLACGGAALVARWAAAEAAHLARIYAIDSSVDMVRVAATQTRDRRVAYVCARAEDLDRVLRHRVSRILCNSAFWLFDSETVIRAAAKILEPSGVLLFNIAEWDCDLGAMDHPKYDAIDAELVDRGLPRKPSRGSPHKLSRARITGMLIACGYVSVSVREFEVPTDAGDWSRFYSIPAIARRSLPSLETGLALAVLAQAMRRLGTVELPAVRWIEVAARAAGA